MAVLSSGRCSLAGVSVPDGWRERASLVLFFTPGMCTIRKRYRRVFSQPRVRDIFLGAISKELEEGLVVDGYDKVAAS